MTSRDTSDLKKLVTDYAETPRTMTEIVDHMANLGENPSVIRNLVIGMTADRKLAFAPGSLGKKLTTTAHAKAMAAHEGGEE